MYVLVDRSLEDALVREGATVVARYPAFVLARADAAPAGLPAGSAEVLSDPAISVHGTRVEIPEGVFELGDAPHTLVRFAGPVAPEWKDALAAAGAEVLFWAPRFGACLRLPEGMDAAALREALPFVVGARPYTEELCSRGLEEQAEHVRQRTGLPGDLYDLVCFSREDRARVETELAAMGIPVLGSSSSKIRVQFDGDPATLRDLVGVKLVDPARAPVLLQSVAAPAAPASGLAAALGLAGPDGGWRSDLTGRGQTVAVADTGLDRGATDDATLHPDFRGRVRALRSWPVNPSWAPFTTRPGSDDGPADRNSGHGTHVAGLAVGSGRVSGGEHRGAAPEAELVFQSIEQHTEIRPAHAARIPTGFYLSGRPLDLRQLFREAREQGARIHVNSWGDPAGGRYTDDCYEADLFLRDNPDAVVLFAAGNDGCDRDGNRVADEGTLYAPASAKNVVAVGATEGPMAGTRALWGGMDATGQRFRNPADRADPVSGETDRLAMFSSAGPTVDGRIKPDVCAPGTNLAAPRSGACSARGWGLASPLPHYMLNGGTSMSNGVAGGFVALLRQAWEAHRGSAPSGAALKALLVLGALPVARRDGRGEEPRSAAGWGRIHFAASAPRQPERVVRLEDDPAAALGSGEVRDFRVAVRRPGALRAVLAWYDAPGETLVNDLDLCLIAPDGRRVWGNHPAGSAGVPDRRNPVEVLHLPDAAPGEYVLRVTGANVPAGPQPFALALFHPAAPGFALPVGWVRGIGDATTRRLAAAGIATADRLAALDERELGERCGMRGRTLAALRERLVVIERAAALRPSPRVPRGLTLAQVTTPGLPAPAGLAPEEWRQVASDLSPLASALQPASLRKVRLGDLFGAAA
ncbi:MAG TPA: S8 family serine peptidase [Longimicrobiaceae bacterium]|jgi:subtilisin family serine protease